MLLINLGAYKYTIELTDRILLDGRRCLGLTDANAQHIRIDRTLKPDKRWAVCWHELTEAWKAEFDPRDDDMMDRESICNLIGMGMVHLSPSTYARLWLYVCRGVIADGAIMLPNHEAPMPFFVDDGGTLSRPSCP